MSFMYNNYAIIEIKSLTNGFSLLKRKMHDPIYSIGVGVNSIIIEAPQKTCVLGQLISIEGFLIIEKSSQAFYSSGKITEVVQMPEGSEQYCIQMYRYDRTAWQKLMNNMNEKQAEVDSLFASLRGEL